MSDIIAQLKGFAPGLVIFDKDGTLIDFHAMWGSWALDLAHNLEDTLAMPLAAPFFDLIGFDPSTSRIVPEGILAVAPQVAFQQKTVEFLMTLGVAHTTAKQAVHTAWFIPDPVTLAKPLTDLKLLFNALHTNGLNVAIATSDDRSGTEATIAGLGLAKHIDGIVCADDGLPIKPEPDMIRHLCHNLDVPPNHCVMVGDNAVDLQMGRAAGVGMTIGVLSGLAGEAELAPFADLLLPSIDSLFIE